jgi:hypothetical protein
MPSERDKASAPWWQMQVSIRDVLLCTVIVALGVAWWSDRQRVHRESEELKRRHGAEIRLLKDEINQLSALVPSGPQMPAP